MKREMKCIKPASNDQQGARFTYTMILSVQYGREGKKNKEGYAFTVQLPRERRVAPVQYPRFPSWILTCTVTQKTKTATNP